MSNVHLVRTSNPKVTLSTDTRLLLVMVVCAAITLAQTPFFGRGGIAIGFLLVLLTFALSGSSRVSAMFSRAIRFSATSLAMATLAAVVLTNAAYPIP